MYTITALNVNDAYPKALSLVADYGARRMSRAGEVLVLKEPLAIQYLRPLERVLFDPLRDANPYFHLMESLWMLQGRNDVAWLANWLPRMSEFSDDGVTFHGAYGYRWREHFTYNSEWRMDQLSMIVNELRANPESRRCVLQMWDATADLGRNTKDVPCNLSVTFQIADERLNMVVFNRSNDLIWGALGANVVHFSVLQQYIADCIEVPVGTYEQVSANAHVYLSEWKKRGYDTMSYIPTPLSSPYERGEVEPFKPLFLPGKRAEWQHDLKMFIEGTQQTPFATSFFDGVVMPLVLSHRAYKLRDFEMAQAHLLNCIATDWRLAAQRWLERRDRVPSTR